ncbi:MAG: hypothetical protein H6563_08455 [Lewinellaceae bacterium]|nr:hypothetical protein [Lewinellaceae bacterium]
MKLSKIVKRSLLTISILLLLLIGALFAIPFLFKDQVLQTIREEVNANLNAKVDFSDVSLTLFRSFPNLTLGLDDLKVSGIGPFEGVDLLDVKTFYATVDIMTVIRGNQPIKLQAIDLQEPKVHVLVLKGGAANYDITKPSETTTQTDTTSSGDIAIQLKRFSIEDGSIIYDDRDGDMYAEILGLNHESKGDLTLDVYDLLTKTTMESLTYEMGGISYLTKAKADLDAGFLIDMAQSKYTLKDNNLILNALQLKADGFVAMPDGDNIDMDLSFQAPGGDFRELFSLIPNAYIEGYENVDVKGQFALSGNVKGRYNDTQYPAIKINATVKDGAVKYPDLPLGINQISADLNIDSPEGDLDGMFIDLSRFTMKVGDNPFGGYLKLRTPMSDPDIDTRVKGTLDLAELAQAFPMDATKGMAGKIVADITAKTRMSTIEAEAYDQVNMQGDITATQIRYPMEGYPPVAIESAVAQFTPNKVIIQNFQAQLGKSDIVASGTIDNILAYISPNKTMTGSITMRSNFFDANEWYSDEETTTSEPGPVPTTETPVEEEAPFDRFDFLVDGRIGKLVYTPYELTNMEVKGHLTPNRMSFAPFKFQMGESDFDISGVITNVWDYTFGDGVLGGNIALRSNYLDVNPFMEDSEPTSTTTTTTASSAETAYSPIEVPGNINMGIDANIKKLLYTNLVLDNLNGRLLVEDKAVVIEHCEANGLDGKIALSGSYETKDPKKPVFTLKYDLQDLNFQKAFNTFNTFQAMAPIGKYIEGKFNSTLIMDSELGPDMMPVWSTMSANGFLQTINSVIKGFPPLQAVGQKLNVGYFDNLTLKGTKNWFEVKDGALELKDFDYSYQGIDMTIGGTHRINQDMNYHIVARIPRKMLEKGSVGAAAGSGLNALSQEAGKLGINLAQSEYVNVQFLITGNIAKPKVAMKLLGGDGQSSVTESVKEQAKQELQQQKEQVVAEAKQKVDTLKKQAQDTVKAVIQQGTEQAKDKAKEVIQDQSKKTQEEIKKELENFNPFKKKKGGK